MGYCLTAFLDVIYKIGHLFSVSQLSVISNP